MEAIQQLRTSGTPNEEVRVPRRLEIRRILVATDYSEPAYRALEAAIVIAEACSSQITLAHAHSEIPSAFRDRVAPDLLIHQALQDEQSMESLVDRSPGMAKLQVETIVENSTPIAMISELTGTRRPDLLVLGSHGKKGVEHLAFGSVAEYIARAATVPVLIIGPHAHSDRKPFESILLATDMGSSGPAQFASLFMERFHSRLVMLHVIEQEPKPFPVRSEIEDRLQQNMQSMLSSENYLRFRPEFSIDYGEPVERIMESARAINATLVVMGTRGGGGLDSHLPWTTLSRVIRQIQCGVLVVPDRPQ